MDRAREIAEFVRAFLAAHQVEAHVDKSGVLTAQLPRTLAEELGTAERLRLTFTPAQSVGEGEKPGAEFLTYGHPLLDRMLAMAKSRGRTTSLLVTSAIDPDFLDALHEYDPFRKATRKEHSPGVGGAEAKLNRGRLGPLARRLSRLTFRNASPRTVEKRIVYHTQVLFVFKIALVSDEKRELIVSLLMDPVTEQIDRSVDVSGAVAFHPEQAGDPLQEEYRLDRLYRRACSHLSGRLQKTIRTYQSEVDDRLRRELRRIEEYYGGLIQEQIEPLRKLFRRMAVASVRADLARSWNTENRYRDEFLELKKESAFLEAQYEKELAALQREKAQRIREVREKHDARVEVTLTHAAFVRVPRVEWRVRLVGQGIRREIAPLFDVLRRRLVGWECESCTDGLGDNVYLCGCSSLVCADCHRECAGCGRVFCRSCSGGDCHICQGPVCPECTTTCPISLYVEALKVCQSCRDEWCPQCRSITVFHAEDADGAFVPAPS